MRIQLKHRIPRQRKTLHRKCIQQFRTLQLGRRRSCRCDLGETVRDEEDEDDEETVCGAFDFEVAEEGVGAKEVEGFVYYVCRGRIGWAVCGELVGMYEACEKVNVPESGDGPLILVLIGRIEVFPTSRTSGSSLSDEWYAYFSMFIVCVDETAPRLTGIASGKLSKDCGDQVRDSDLITVRGVSLPHRLSGRANNLHSPTTTPTTASRMNVAGDAEDQRSLMSTRSVDPKAQTVSSEFYNVGPDVSRTERGIVQNL